MARRSAFRANHNIKTPARWSRRNPVFSRSILFREFLGPVFSRSVYTIRAGTGQTPGQAESGLFAPQPAVAGTIYSATDKAGHRSLGTLVSLA